MTKTERDELRAKHFRVDCYCDDSCGRDFCDGCRYAYPCDTIRALDALDELERHANRLGDLLANVEDERDELADRVDRAKTLLASLNFAPERKRIFSILNGEQP